jgi:hypothetical protein
MSSESMKIKGKLELSMVGDNHNTDEAVKTFLRETEQNNNHFQVSVLLVDFLVISFRPWSRSAQQVLGNVVDFFSKNSDDFRTDFNSHEDTSSQIIYYICTMKVCDFL